MSCNEILPSGGRQGFAAADTALGRLKKTLRGGGLVYSAMHFARLLLRSILESIERRMAALERRKGLLDPWTVLAGRFTVEENKQLWNSYDWSSQGEEWTRSAQWKDRLVREFLLPYISGAKTVLEIGPGAGRWTEILQRSAEQLFVVDVSERAIALCRSRFAGCPNIEYRVGDGQTIDVPSQSVDCIWSYDVFVHINPLDARRYFAEMQRVLKPGAFGVIHHPGPAWRAGKKRRGWRSDLTDEMVLSFLRENQLHIVNRNEDLVNRGDILTVFQKPVVPRIEDGNRALPPNNGKQLLRSEVVVALE